MKLLFVNVCLRPDAPHRYLPVGLGYIVTAVERAGFDFDILDVDIDSLTDDTVEKYIATHKYDVIAVGSIVTHYKWVKWLAHTVKRHHPGCTVIVGNSVGSSVPEIICHYAPVDVVVLGEGDITIVEVLRALNEGRPLGEAVMPEVPVLHGNGDAPATIKGVGVEGIVFRDSRGRLVNNGPRKAARHIDDLPFPNWDLFDVQRYIERARGTAHATPDLPQEKAVVMPVNTARGCVFKCTFCHYVFWNDPYRHRSPTSIIGEIRHNQEKYGANYINFWDELSFHKLEPAEKFVDALIESNLGIKWTAAVRTDLFGRSDVPQADRRRVAEKFKRAGAVALGYSLESANEEILTEMNKKVHAPYFIEQIELLRDIGIISNTSLVVGYPQESPATIAETMEMCRKARIYPSVGFLLPMPATGMWKYALDHRHITDPDEFLTNLTERQDLIVNMTKMSNEQLFDEVRGWLTRLAQEFGLDNLKDLIRTGGEARHAKHQEKEFLETDVQTHRNTADTFNYARMSGSV